MRRCHGGGLVSSTRVRPEQPLPPIAQPSQWRCQREWGDTPSSAIKIVCLNISGYLQANVKSADLLCFMFLWEKKLKDNLSFSLSEIWSNTPEPSSPSHIHKHCYVCLGRGGGRGKQTRFVVMCMTQDINIDTTCEPRKRTICFTYYISKDTRSDGEKKGRK